MRTPIVSKIPEISMGGLVFGDAACGLLASGLAAQRGFDSSDQAIESERFVQHSLQTFAACLHDRVACVIAKAGHKDDGRRGLDFVKGFENLGAVHVRQPNVGEEYVVRAES